MAPLNPVRLYRHPEMASFSPGQLQWACFERLLFWQLVCCAICLCLCVCVCVCVILYGVGGTKHPQSSLENAPHNYLRIHPSMVITITYSLPEYSPLCTLNATEYLPHNIIRHLNMLPKIPYSTPEYPHHNTI